MPNSWRTSPVPVDEAAVIDIPDLEEVGATSEDTATVPTTPPSVPAEPATRFNSPGGLQRIQRPCPYLSANPDTFSTADAAFCPDTSLTTFSNFGTYPIPLVGKSPESATFTTTPTSRCSSYGFPPTPDNETEVPKIRLCSASRSG